MENNSEEENNIVCAARNLFHALGIGEGDFAILTVE
jgi:hypothetical protein